MRNVSLSPSFQGQRVDRIKRPLKQHPSPARGVRQRLIGTFAGFVAPDTLTSRLINMHFAQFPFIWISVPFSKRGWAGMKWYRRKMNACEKPLGRLSRMENKSSAFLFEDVANYMMVNGEHNKTRPPLARCHWPRSVIVGWMCFRARGQFVCI